MRIRFVTWTFVSLGLLYLIGLLYFATDSTLSASSVQSEEREYDDQLWINSRSLALWPSPANVNIDSTGKKIHLSAAPQLRTRLCGKAPNVTAALGRLMSETFPHSARCAGSSTPSDQVVYLTADLCSRLKSMDIESYTLEMAPESAPDSLLISASSMEGFVWAFRTLSLLLFAQRRTLKHCSYEFPGAIRIEDTPHVSFRSFLIDTARNYIPVSTIMAIVRLMSHLKFNVLHWHIIDETTFGIEMEKHPRLHRNQLWYYSKDEIRKVVQYAAENAVRVVPEVNPFSHASSWKNGYANLIPSCPVWSCSASWGLMLNIFDKRVQDVVLAVLDETMDLFPDPIFHLGGDEPVLGCWLENSAMLKFLQEHFWTTRSAQCALRVVLNGTTNGRELCGLKVEPERFLKHSVKLAGAFRPFLELLHRRGKTVIMWHEVWESGAVHSRDGSDLGPQYMHLWDDASPSSLLSYQLQGIVYASPWYLDARCHDIYDCFSAGLAPGWLTTERLRRIFIEKLIGFTASAFEMDEESLFRYNAWQRLVAISQRFWGGDRNLDPSIATLRQSCEWLDERKIFANNSWAAKLGYSFNSPPQPRSARETNFQVSFARLHQSGRRAELICSVASMENKGHLQQCMNGHCQTLNAQNAPEWIETKTRVHSFAQQLWGDNKLR